MSKYPYCERCGDEINPKYEDCQEYYITDDGIMCRECFKEHAQELLDESPDQIAQLLGYSVRYLNRGRQ